MQISLIAALDDTRGIGLNGGIPWKNRDDLRHFSRTTIGGGNNAVIMGRKTFESIGKILSDRINIVLSSSMESRDDVGVVRTINEGITYAKCREVETLWVIGGAELYRDMIENYRHLIDVCVISKINGDYKCDVHFPCLDARWRQSYSFYIGDNMLEVVHYKNLLKNMKRILKPEGVPRAAFITGITGQDGSYLAELLIEKGYDVFGIVRRTSRLYESTRIDHIREHIRLFYGDLTDGYCLSNIVNTIVNTKKYDVCEIYNLAAQSHVGVSFELPEYTADVDGIGVLRMLEIVRSVQANTSCSLKLYQAGTSELYGAANGREIQSLETNFNPVSPYAAAKLYAYHMVKMYRDGYNMYNVNGLLFNHESPRRGENFVTMKVVNGIKDILAGKREKISLGNLHSKRDWGHAKDYVRGMWLMMQQDGIPKDYLLATGETHSVKEFVEKAFLHAGMEITWKGSGLHETGVDSSGNVRVDINPKYFRPNEVDFLLGDPSRAEKELGWTREYSFDKLITDMFEGN